MVGGRQFGASFRVTHVILPRGAPVSIRFLPPELKKSRFRFGGHLRPMPSAKWGGGQSCGILDSSSALLMDAYGVSSEAGMRWARIVVNTKYSSLSEYITNRNCVGLKHVFVEGELLQNSL